MSEKAMYAVLGDEVDKGSKPGIDYGDFYEKNEKGELYLEPRRLLDEVSGKNMGICFSSDELNSLDRIDYPWSNGERLVISDLVNYMGLLRSENPRDNWATGKVLYGLGSYLMGEYKSELENSRDIDSDSLTAELRRTVVMIYKAARVPVRSVKSGGFKNVWGPIGWDKDFYLGTYDQIVRAIGSVKKWDGRFPVEKITEALNDDSPKRKMQFAQLWEKKASSPTALAAWVMGDGFEEIVDNQDGDSESGGDVVEESMNVDQNLIVTPPMESTTHLRVQTPDEER